MVRIDPPGLKHGLIAPCGMNCALCLAFQRSQQKCPGCWEDDPIKAKSCRLCIIRNCTTIQNNSSHSCYECEKMPCKRLKQLDIRYRTKYGMSMIANLIEINDQGMDAFLVHQAKKYTCGKCGGLLCVHRSRCLTCDPWAPLFFRYIFAFCWQIVWFTLPPLSSRKNPHNRRTYRSGMKELPQTVQHTPMKWSWAVLWIVISKVMGCKSPIELNFMYKIATLFCVLRMWIWNKERYTW